MRICANFLYVIAHGFSPMNTDKEIKKILKIDYPRGRAKEHSANFISIQ